MAPDGGCALCCWPATHSRTLAQRRSGCSLELLLGDLLVCFDVLDKALSAGFQFGVAQLGDALRSRVRALLRCAKDCDGDDEDYDLPQYVLRWSRLLCAERREIALNWSDLLDRDAYAFVAPLLCRRLRRKDKESVFVALAAIAATFANCESLRVHGGSPSLLRLDAAVLDYVLKQLARAHCRLSRLQIDAVAPRSPLLKEQAVKLYHARFAAICWRLGLRATLKMHGAPKSLVRDKVS